MQDPQAVHNLIILDESGSMESIKTATLSAFNEIVQTVKGSAQAFPQQQHFISLISFNGLGTKTHLWTQPVARLKGVHANRYRPDASTPLYDAMGHSLSRLHAELLAQPGAKVLVTVFTDGEENASREFNGQQINSLVGNLKERGWIFSYIGADHNVEEAAARLNITNVVRFEKSAQGLEEFKLKEQKARHRMMANMNDVQANLNETLYEEEAAPRR